MRIEAMPEIGLGDRIPRPVRRLGVEKDDAGFRVLFVRVAPDIVVPMTGAGWRVSRALEPRVLIRSVVHHEFRYDAQTARVRLADEAAQVAHRPIAGIHVTVIGDGVAVVAQPLGRASGRERVCTYG